MLVSSALCQVIKPLETTESLGESDDSLETGGTDGDEENEQFGTRPKLRFMDGMDFCKVDPKAIGVA